MVTSEKHTSIVRQSCTENTRPEDFESACGMLFLTTLVRISWFLHSLGQNLSFPVDWRRETMQQIIAVPRIRKAARRPPFNGYFMSCDFLKASTNPCCASIAGSQRPALMKSVIGSGTVPAAGGGGGGVAPGTDQASSVDTVIRSVILSFVMFQTILSAASDKGPS